MVVGEHWLAAVEACEGCGYVRVALAAGSLRAVAAALVPMLTAAGRDV
jgi:hypothetical protein